MPLRLLARLLLCCLFSHAPCLREFFFFPLMPADTCRHCLYHLRRFSPPPRERARAFRHAAMPPCCCHDSLCCHIREFAAFDALLRWLLFSAIDFRAMPYMPPAFDIAACRAIRPCCADDAARCHMRYATLRFCCYARARLHMFCCCLFMLLMLLIRAPWRCLHITIA